MYSVSLRSNSSCCSTILKSRCQIPFNVHLHDSGDVLKPLESFDPDNPPNIVFKKPPVPRSVSARHQAARRRNENLFRFLRTAWETFMRDFEKEHKDGTNCTLCGGTNQSDSVLKDFEPFDIDKWYVERLLQKIGIEN
ncbi:hypothetical protein M514_08562 [Trichuris suis]|uniref:Uncharacterized protein n=1 Tax=Trichuris suis TaxID=68888 RepID=A0A085M067_9BILA|nr:hypothetical protein M513_08562 [Trichuris suis]KFD67706.1 hypothetical protein M514_08562 [Trichuris suis]KHJ45286.1 hypothetical protein D918_04592 [Trichuris suis]